MHHGTEHNGGGPITADREALEGSTRAAPLNRTGGLKQSVGEADMHTEAAKVGNAGQPAVAHPELASGCASDCVRACTLLQGGVDHPPLHELVAQPLA